MKFTIGRNTFTIGRGSVFIWEQKRWESKGFSFRWERKSDRSLDEMSPCLDLGKAHVSVTTYCRPFVSIHLKAFELYLNSTRPHNSLKIRVFPLRFAIYVNEGHGSPFIQFLSLNILPKAGAPKRQSGPSAAMMEAMG